MTYQELFEQMLEMPVEWRKKEVLIYVSPSAYSVEPKLFYSEDTKGLYINKEGTVI